ncbi:MAG TPA: hypothetical protein DEB46_05535 [Myxococcales bacterium]|nr:hypothetical protein [Myxococcales bacterium]
MTRRFLLLGWFLLTATSAWSANDLSAVDEACHGELEDYDVPIGPDLEAFNQIQNSQMLNHPALYMMVSSVSAPLSKGGRLSLELAQIPALNCMQRTVVFAGKLKSEDTNKLAVLPRPRLTVSLPPVGSMHGSLTLAYLPPIKFGTTSAHAVGVSLSLHSRFGANFDLGLRLQGLTGRIADDIARNTVPDGPIYLDFYSPGVIGLGFHAGYDLKAALPGLAMYAEADFVNVGTFFVVGDDNVVVNNRYPFLGLVYSLGAQMVHRGIDLGLGWHHAPGSTYGGLRARLGYRWD